MYLEKKILELKKEHKDIFHMAIGQEDFLFRPLTKQEYDDFVIQPTMDEGYIAEEVCKMCVLYPKGYDFYDPRYAGIPETLSEQIIEKSGFSDEKFVERLLLEYKYSNQNDKHRQIVNTIIGVFPEITLNDIDDFNVYEILDLYSRAEWIINNLRADLVHPEVVQAEREQARQEQQQQQYQFKNNNNSMKLEDMTTEDIPKHWDIDEEGLKKIQENQNKQNNNEKPGMMNMQTLGGAQMSVPQRSISNQEYQEQQEQQEEE